MPMSIICPDCKIDLRKVEESSKDLKECRDCGRRMYISGWLGLYENKKEHPNINFSQVKLSENEKEP